MWWRAKKRRKKRKSPHVVIVVLTGASGSGKTTFRKNLETRLALRGVRTGELSKDRFFSCQGHLSEEERARLNYDHPDAYNWPGYNGAVQSVKQGKKAKIPFYDFDTHSVDTDKTDILDPEEVDVVFIDGIMPLLTPEMRENYDLVVGMWVFTILPFFRRAKRDVKERKRTLGSVLRQYPSVIAGYVRYCLPYLVFHTDIPVLWGGNNQLALWWAERRILELLSRTS